jgi:hypothetical protein
MAGIGLLCITLTGCDNLAPGPTRSVGDRPADSLSTLLPGTSVASVRAAATQVLKEHFRIDTENSTAVVLRSQPADTTAHADNETPRMNEVLSGRSGRRRQVAEIVLVERGADVVVRCRVQVQRRETPERAAFAPQRSGEDRPAEMTAAERGAITETRTRDEWVNVGRDRQLERTMLDQIAERAERGAVVPATPATRPQS